VATGAWDVNQLRVVGALTRLFGFKSDAVFSIFLNNFAWSVFHSWVLKGFDSSRRERYLDRVVVGNRLASSDATSSTGQSTNAGCAPH